MGFMRSLLSNRPLANIAFVVVLLLGISSYLSMPREQDPEINFNWVAISAQLPGASAQEVERLLVDPIEEAIKGVSDIRFVTSTARENSASMLVRFHDVSERVFDKRMADLRREIQNKANSELPPGVEQPVITEITTSNGFPTASLVLSGPTDGERLRLAGRRIKGDLERISGVDAVLASGLREPELVVRPDAQALAARGLLAADVANALSAWWRDSNPGLLNTAAGSWSIALQGLSTDPAALLDLPIAPSLRGGATVRLGDVARIERDRAPASQYSSTDGQAAVLLTVTKKSRTNTLALVDRLGAYLESENARLAPDGLRLALSDDQTVPTREAINIMQTNALYGLVLLLAVCWLFLGWRIGVLVAIGIPFSLLGSFAVLAALGHTVNVSVLLGVVIALGMLVDDAVVVVEAIYYRTQRGQEALSASLDALAEVWRPVLTSVATTVAAFLPLLLLPGIVGKFMFVIPFVVTLALLISLLEAFWILPVHVTAMRPPKRSTQSAAWRTQFNRQLRLGYGRLLAYTLRRPLRFALASLGLVSLAVALVNSGMVRVQFFAFDPIRAFYVNVDMPPNATLEQTLAETQRVEQAVRLRLLGIGPAGDASATDAPEARSVTSTAGLKFTDTEQVFGDTVGQVFVSLNPRRSGNGDAEREVTEVVHAMRAEIEAMGGPGRKSFTLLEGGPPAGKAISVKVRGDEFAAIERAADALRGIIERLPATQDVQDDRQAGRQQLGLRIDRDALSATELSPTQLSRELRLALEGEVIAFTREAGDKIALRVKNQPLGQDSPGGLLIDPAALLDQPIAIGGTGGGQTQLGQLLHAEVQSNRGFIRHHNLRRAITVEANLDTERTDTRSANLAIQAEWAKLQPKHPGVDLDFSGELEDIEESLSAMQRLFLLGVGLIYLILAAQFRSYWQPLMILVTVPLAFTGVALGLFITSNPLSLYTLYGVIALSGIAVNSAIVLIDAANQRLHSGMVCAHAIVYAGRRRVVPILITTTTTIGGLFSLAIGLGGKSLLWGPVAASIVWGLTVSSVLTLFVVPLLYQAFMGRRARPADQATVARA